MKQLLGAPGVGFAAQRMVARFFVLQYWCAGIALAHLVVGWLQEGRPLLRPPLGLVSVLFVLVLAGGLWVQPKLSALHRLKYYGAKPEVRAQADKTFRAWHAASQCANLLVIGGLLLYLWKMTETPLSPRFGRLSKIQG